MTEDVKTVITDFKSGASPRSQHRSDNHLQSMQQGGTMRSPIMTALLPSPREQARQVATGHLQLITKRGVRYPSNPTFVAGRSISGMKSVGNSTMASKSSLYPMSGLAASFTANCWIRKLS